MRKNKVVIKREIFLFLNKPAAQIIQQVQEFIQQYPNHTAVISSPFWDNVNIDTFEMVLYNLTEACVSWRVMAGCSRLSDIEDDSNYTSVITDLTWQRLKQKEFIQKIKQINAECDSTRYAEGAQITEKGLRIADKERMVADYLSDTYLAYDIVLESDLRPRKISRNELDMEAMRKEARSYIDNNKGFDIQACMYIADCKVRGMSRPETLRHIIALAQKEEKWKKYEPLSLEKISRAVISAEAVGLVPYTGLWKKAPHRSCESVFTDEAVIEMIDMRAAGKMTLQQLAYTIKDLSETDNKWSPFKPVTVGKVKAAIFHYKRLNGINPSERPLQFSKKDVEAILAFKDSINPSTGVPHTFQQTAFYFNELAKTDAYWAERKPFTMGRIVRLRKRANDDI